MVQISDLGATPSSRSIQHQINITWVSLFKLLLVNILLADLAYCQDADQSKPMSSSVVNTLNTRRPGNVIVHFDANNDIKALEYVTDNQEDEEEQEENIIETRPLSNIGPNRQQQQQQPGSQTQGSYVNMPNVIVVSPSGNTNQMMGQMGPPHPHRVVTRRKDRKRKTSKLEKIKDKIKDKIKNKLRINSKEVGDLKEETYDYQDLQYVLTEQSDGSKAYEKYV